MRTGSTLEDTHSGQRWSSPRKCWKVYSRVWVLRPGEPHCHNPSQPEAASPLRLPLWVELPNYGLPASWGPERELGGAHPDVHEILSGLGRRVGRRGDLSHSPLRAAQPHRSSACGFCLRTMSLSCVVSESAFSPARSTLASVWPRASQRPCLHKGTTGEPRAVSLNSCSSSRAALDPADPSPCSFPHSYPEVPSLTFFTTSLVILPRELHLAITQDSSSCCTT